MSRRTPQLTSDLAKDVYALSQFPSIKDALGTLNARYGKILTFADSNLLSAKTGGPAGIKISSAFGFVLLGQGALKGHAFILFRGTQLLADWLTNFNIAPARSDSGYLVHDGFNKSFNSMKPKLTEFRKVLTKQKVSHVHCIGHSLGGALATLCANWLQNQYSTYLYTFGSPRVGLYDFSNYLTTQMTSKRIYRVYHKTDPVPMIPTWPFVHIPESGQDYWLPSPGVLPSPEYHAMDKYTTSVSTNSWGTLSGFREAHKDDIQIAQWLMEKTRATFSMNTLRWLGNALIYVLKKIKAIVSAQQITGQFTVMDHLAYVLAKGIDLAETLSNWVLLFIRKVMEVLGLKPVEKSGELNKDFIRNMLNRLQAKINTQVEAALRYQV
jgi:pimeloyl-ACP methyl ester carboxylesterase